jgi:uncharacterized protein
MDDLLHQKQARLLEILRAMGRPVVAFSGGVDSAVVALVAFQAVGEAAIAVTANSPSVPRAEIEEARQIAKLIGIRHEIISTREFSDPNYLRNDGARCYFCKSELYNNIAEHLATWNSTTICSGANTDDLGDYRPGLVAAAERAIRHPLIEAGIGKQEVRQIAHASHLPIWDKPASPCLSSRLAPGVAVTIERANRVEAAEKLLKELGLRDCRVRLHEGELARLEVPIEAIARLAEPSIRQRLTERLKQLGFRYVTLDLEGLRSGSLNDLVDLTVRARYAPSKQTPILPEISP